MFKGTLIKESLENEEIWDSTFVVFAGKIFKYPKGDLEKRKEAQEYGRTLGIPERQLDWKG